MNKKWRELEEIRLQKNLDVHLLFYLTFLD